MNHNDIKMIFYTHSDLCHNIGTIGLQDYRIDCKNNNGYYYNNVTAYTHLQ